MRCRYCKKNLMFGAKRCQYCGRMVNGDDDVDAYGGNSKRGVVTLAVCGSLVVLTLIGVLVLLPALSDRGTGSDRVHGPAKQTEATYPEEDLWLPETEPWETEIPETEPVETMPPATEPVQTVEEFTITSYQELKDKLAPECISKPISATFLYLGNEGLITYEEVCCLLGARAASVTERGDGKLEIMALPYAGARILDAYRNGTTDSLSEDEKAALAIAEEVVAQARRDANSDLELERMLHDWMCRNISYYDVDFSIEFTEKRPLNVIGALLDGKANCQGYTDCFYLLANMAGFVVDKQSYPEHTFNTIKLGGQWYMMDVTHDDQTREAYGTEYPTYQHFNASHADSDGRSWLTWTERNPIAQTTGSYYYYEEREFLGADHIYQKTFSSLQDAARSVYAERSTGRTVHHALVRGTSQDYDQMGKALEAEGGRVGNYERFYVFGHNSNGNAFFLVVFEH